MARVAKIDNAIKKRFERTEKKRFIDTREKLVYFLIVCEGEKTEPEYFKALEKDLPIGTVELKIDGTGRNTTGLVDYTIIQKEKAFRKFDQVWAVFDKDDFPDRNFNNAIQKASANNIRCAWSNEAFELWFLLHFQFVNNKMNREDYKEYLEREVKRVSCNKNYKYKKNDPSTFLILKEYGNQEQAIVNSKKLESQFKNKKYATHNPCTHVYKLIEELAKYSRNK